MPLAKLPLRGLMHSSRKSPLRGLLMYDFRKSSFERAVDICEKQCLLLGLTCIALGNRL